jgi:hypothetical protein
MSRCEGWNLKWTWYWRRVDLSDPVLRAVHNHLTSNTPSAIHPHQVPQDSQIHISQICYKANFTEIGKSKALVLTEAERLQRREESARRRKRQTEQRQQDEQVCLGLSAFIASFSFPLVWDWSCLVLWWSGYLEWSERVVGLLLSG